MTAIEVTGDLASLDAALEALPNSPGGLRALAQRRRAVSLQDRPPAAPPAAPAEGTREAVAPAEPAAHRRAHRVLADRLRIRIERGALRAGAAPLPRVLSGPAQAAHAAVSQDRPQQRVPAQPHHHPPHPHGRPVFRAVPLARFRREVRRPVPGPVPDAALPGRPGPFARAPRLHLRRNGHVPAAVPVGGGPAEYAHEVARVVEFLRTDGRSLADAIAHSRDRLSDDDAVRGGRAPAQASGKGGGRAETARRTGARCGPSERRRHHALPGALCRRDVVRARRQLAAAAAVWFRSAGRQAGLARPQPARDVRRGRAAESWRSASGRSIWRCWRAGTTPVGAKANG